MNRVARMLPFLLPLSVAAATADGNRGADQTLSFVNRIKSSPSAPVFSDSPKKTSESSTNYSELVARIDSLHGLFAKAGEEPPSIRLCTERLAITKEASLEFMYLDLMTAAKNAVNEGSLSETARSGILITSGDKLKEVEAQATRIGGACERAYHHTGQKKLILT